MIIGGKHMENITCKVCRHRHPASISCHEAERIAKLQKAEREANYVPERSEVEVLREQNARYREALEECVKMEYYDGQMDVARKALEEGQ